MSAMATQAGPAPGDHIDQRIQYARTSDGVNIAYAVTGSGPLLVIVPDPPVSHLNAEWEIPERRDRVVQFSRYRTVVRFDSRGTGLSDRGITDYSLEARMRDLEAVLARFPDEPFALFAFSHGCQLAVACASRAVAMPDSDW